MGVEHASERDVDIVIVGSGFSGIGAAIELQNKGFHDYVILEKADRLGGTWRDATYPGLTVDMPSFIYSYPFAMSADWDHVYPRGGQILDYTIADAHIANAWAGIEAGVRRLDASLGGTGGCPFAPRATGNR